MDHVAYPRVTQGCRAGENRRRVDHRKPVDVKAVDDAIPTEADAAAAVLDVAVAEDHGEYIVQADRTGTPTTA